MGKPAKDDWQEVLERVLMKSGADCIPKFRGQMHIIDLSRLVEAGQGTW